MTKRAVLEANAAFYKAFAEGDVAAMERIWASGVDVACIHPGWPPIVGRTSVLKSWTGVLSNPPPIAAESARAILTGSTAAVLCLERIGSNVLAATNLFILEDGDWRIYHHQASQIARAAPRARPARPRVVAPSAPAVIAPARNETAPNETATNETAPATNEAAPATNETAPGTNERVTARAVVDAPALLAVGSIVEFGDVDPPQRARLGWVSPSRTRYVFTSAAGGGRIMTADELSAALAQGHARVTSERASVFGQALAVALGEAEH